MKAVRIETPEGFEGIDGLVYEDAPDPQPAIGDALVQVRAASFTPTELTWPLRTDRAGHDRGALAAELRALLGRPRLRYSRNRATGR